jgi:hypothetical protein
MWKKWSCDKYNVIKVKMILHEINLVTIEIKFSWKQLHVYNTLLVSEFPMIMLKSQNPKPHMKFSVILVAQTD